MILVLKNYKYTINLIKKTLWWIAEMGGCVRLCNNYIQLLKFVFLFLNQVFGIGVPNPYRLRPFIGARVPVNSSFSPIINIHNPHSEPLQVSIREKGLNACLWY